MNSAKTVLVGLLASCTLTFCANAAIRAVTPVAWNGKPDCWQMKRHAEKMSVVTNGGAKIVFVGDSITHNWESKGKAQWAKYFASGKRAALNLGYSADRTEHVLWRIKEGGELDGYEAKCILLMIGTNNTGHFPIEEESPADTILGIHEVLAAIAEKQPKARTILMSIFPRGADPSDPNRRRNDVVNKEIARFADGKRVIWCDFSDKFLDVQGRLSRELFPDLLHPIGLGYEIWASSVIPVIDAVLGAEEDEYIPSVWPSLPRGYVCEGAVAAHPAASHLDELMPVPVSVESRTGFADAAACAKVSVRTANVPGAPSSTADEAYVLEVTPDGVSIVAPTARGERWARVTLDQLVRLSGGLVPCCRITDWPRFKWRGFMHDSGRNFLEVEHVKGVIDAMSRCKMNLFHWHFTEYYGWRLESKRFPELQRPDSFYLRYIGKYYTQDEFREVVDYAAARGVTVMPELDVPGHALAFRRAFGFQTMRDEGVREKFCALVDELCSLVPREKMPFIHLGTDEARLPEEKVPPQWMAPIIACARANGRTVVGWTPGELAGLTEGGGVVGMRWGRPKPVDTTGVLPFLDASQMYIDTLEPFEIPAVATYRRVCPWNESEGERLGAVVCAWHDDFAGTGFRTLVNQAVLPSLVLFGDAYWRGRDDEPAGWGGRTTPRGGDPRLGKLADIERRTVAQRDRVWADSPYPFHFLRQSDMRWRVSLADGTLLATNVAQATVFLWQSALAGEEGGRENPMGGNLTTNRIGTAILETWIHAPSNIACGAWIGFTDFTRNHGRACSAPTPDVGMWNRFGATVEINGEQVPPPKWRKPGQLAGAEVPHLKYVHELDEIAFEDEEYYMREPTAIKLAKGWNHVRLTVPMKKRAGGHAPWVGTFIPLLGSTDHPREVPGLSYSSSPKAAEQNPN